MCRGVNSLASSLPNPKTQDRPGGLLAESTSESLSSAPSTTGPQSWLLEGKCYRETPAEPGKAKARWAVIGG